MVAAARQIQAVAIGWQVYDLARETRSIEESALLLGLVGLCEFLPVLLLSLVGGQAADRIDRKLILLVCGCVRIIAALILAASVFMPTSTALPVIFGTAALVGVVNAFTPAASNSLFPLLVPRSDLPQAIAWNSLAFQGASIWGPAVGGLLFIAGADVAFLGSAVLTVCGIAALVMARVPKHEPLANARATEMMLEGLKFVRDNKIVLGAISLDLIVVLFGGAIALLPIFARDILHTGPEGLGLLRAAPAAGAALVGLSLTYKPLARKVGYWMFGSVAVYGVAMFLFAFSTVFWLSMLLLAISGAADMISVYVRQSLIQLATPDGMRGRVSSVSFLFISASNELGDFESGVAARFLGPIGAVVLGSVVAVVTALLWVRLFPELARADRFADAAPPGSDLAHPATGVSGAAAVKLSSDAPEARTDRANRTS